VKIYCVYITFHINDKYRTHIQHTELSIRSTASCVTNRQTDGQTGGQTRCRERQASHVLLLSWPSSDQLASETRSDPTQTYNRAYRHTYEHTYMYCRLPTTVCTKLSRELSTMCLAEMPRIARHASQSTHKVTNTSSSRVWYSRSLSARMQQSDVTCHHLIWLLIYQWTINRTTH